MTLYLLDYGAGNVKSLANSLKKLGHDFIWIEKPEDFAKADVSTTIPSVLPRYSKNMTNVSESLEAYFSGSRSIQACNG